MGFLCVTRGVFTRGGCYAAQVRNYAGLFKCATSLPPAGLRVKRYCQTTADGKNVSGKFVCYHLPSRAIVKIEGEETSTFLQGLITNDMGLLVDERELSAMYSHMLSVQGRTLYDIILYRYAFISLVTCFVSYPLTRLCVDYKEGVDPYLLPRGEADAASPREDFLAPRAYALLIIEMPFSLLSYI